MKVNALLQSLRQERDKKAQELEKLDQVISSLSQLNGHRPQHRSAQRRVHRRAWTPAMRRAAAKRMKKMWKEGRIRK